MRKEVYYRLRFEEHELRIIGELLFLWGGMLGK